MVGNIDPHLVVHFDMAKITASRPSIFGKVLKKWYHENWGTVEFECVLTVITKIPGGQKCHGDCVRDPRTVFLGIPDKIPGSPGDGDCQITR